VYIEIEKKSGCGAFSGFQLILAKNKPFFATIFFLAFLAVVLNLWTKQVKTFDKKLVI
jgi:hypothetical protein